MASITMRVAKIINLPEDHSIAFMIAIGKVISIYLTFIILNSIHNMLMST